MFKSMITILCTLFLLTATLFTAKDTMFEQTSQTKVVLRTVHDFLVDPTEERINAIKEFARLADLSTEYPRKFLLDWIAKELTHLGRLHNEGKIEPASFKRQQTILLELRASVWMIAMGGTMIDHYFLFKKES